MEIRPKKPHFFKPILPGFKNSLKIPVGFLKYLKGHDQHEHAILKRAGKNWLVKLNDHRFEEGWGKFAEEFDLQLRDILVFRHEGDMEFEVSIFDSSHCDREYAEYMQEEKTNNGDRKYAEYFQIEEEDWDEDEEEDEEAAAHDKPFGQSHFECTIRPYCLSKGFLCLPRHFVFANGLTNKKCCLIVRDERQRSWNLRITSNKIQVCIGDGWRKFIADNCLKEGDRIKFEVVTDGETPIWKFQVDSKAEAPLQKFQVTDLRTSSVTTPNSQVAASTSAYGNPRLSHCNTEYAEYLQEEDEEAEEDEFEEDEYKEKEEDEEEEDGKKGEEGSIHDKPFGQSHFECTVRPYCLSKGFLCLPKHFVFANGLTNKKCALIIRDERQRSWNLRITSSKTQVCIGDGWRKFIADNCLKEGDRIKFEVVTNGETPIWKFHVVTDAETPLQKFQDPRLKTSNVTTPNSQVAASTSADAANPHLSHCNTEYAQCLQEEEEDEEVEEDEFDMEDEYEEEEDKEKGEEVATHNKPFGQSHFECTIRPYCLSKSFLCLPKPFVFANGLTNIKCGLVIRDERQRSWNLRIFSSKSQVLIGDGWRKFIADNRLKEGDRIKFEVVTDGETPIWKFQVVTDAKTPLQKFQGQSHFECTIGRYCLSRGYLFLPQQFAIANGLINKNCWLIVRDKRKRSWKLKISHSNNPRPRVYIGGGWSKFIAENCLKEGGRIMFEVVTNGETPIWKFHVVTNGETPIKKFQEKPRPSIKLSDETSSHAEAATNEPCVQSYFECTIRQYCLSRGLLYLPQQFAFANGLIDKNCDLIIRDERQRSWNLKLRYWEPIVYITDEWRKFIADNCLKEGDRIKFEVVTNGETPIWKFQVVSEAETPLQKFQDIMKKPSNVSPLDAQGSTSVDDDHPFFISTIKPYCISKTEFCLPTDFVKSNGLINRKCEMILQDEAQRCWSVWLGRIGNRFGITRGWTVFRAANGLQVGDAYKFELIKNGEVPIAHFHCRYSKKVAKRKKR